MIDSTKKTILIVVGITSLALGIVGIFLPLLPTTPFILLSAACFSRSSKRLHGWLLTRPHLGSIIRDWDQRGAISIKAKIISTIMIVALFSYTLIFVDVNLIIKSIVATIGVGILTFILSRPN
ncbi:MAG: hypothetical protein Fur0010_12160 [Bdellovibrio sp.]